MSVLIKAIILSISPISELRGGIPFAVASGINVLTAFIFLTFANVLIIPAIFFFLDNLHVYFMKIRLYRNIFNFYIDRLRKRVTKKMNHWQYFVLFSFVALPFPGSGAYTGCIVSWLFNMDRKKSLLTIALGVVVAGIVVSLATIGIKLFWWE